MADEETQGQEATSWWAREAPIEPSTPSTGFDEPLLWPELPAWDEQVQPDADASVLALPGPPAVIEGESVFAPVADPAVGADIDPMPDIEVLWVPVDIDAPAATGLPDGVDDPDAPAWRDEPLGGLGGGSGWAAPTADAALGESIWGDSATPDVSDAILVTTTPGTPAVYPESDRGGGSRRRRFDVHSGNAAVIALISLASLVLLGMFLSVRSRDNVRTDVSQQRPPTTGDQIAVTGQLNTVPFSPTTLPPGSIDIAGLVPVTETTETTSAPTATTRATAPATTAAVTQPTTATTAAPATTTSVTTTATTTPVDQTSTTLRRTTTSFTLPTFPTTTVPPVTSTWFMIPTIPSS